MFKASAIRSIKSRGTSIKEFLVNIPLMVLVPLTVILATGSSAAVMHFNSVNSNSIKKTGEVNSSRVTKQNKLSDTKVKTPGSNTTNSANPATTTQYAAYDPRSANQTLQPTPDKPAIPNANKPLTISSTYITLYKNVNNATGIKPGISETTITVSSSDNKLMNYPVSSGNFLLTSSGSFSPSAIWTLTVGTGYASIGTSDIKISAIALDGSVNYVGVIHVTVLPLPTFYLTAASPLFVTNSYTSTNFNFFGVPGITYSNGFSPTDQPVLSLENSNGLQFTNVGYDSVSTHFATTTLLDPTISQLHINLIYQNQFQLLSIPLTVYVLNY